MKRKHLSVELYLPFPKAIATLHNRLSATSHELACWVCFEEIKAYVHAHEFAQPPELNLTGISLTDWPSSRENSTPPYVATLASSFFLAECIDNFVPTHRYISYPSLTERWRNKFENDEMVSAFIKGTVRQSRLIDFVPGLGFSELTGDQSSPPAEWAMFDLSQVVTVEDEDFLPEEDVSKRSKATEIDQLPNLKNPKPMRDKQRRQEQEIVNAVKRLGHDPQKLPKEKNGSSGVRSQVRKQLTIPGELFGTAKTFESAWDRARLLGEIKSIE